MYCSVYGSVCLVCCVFDSVCELFGETVCYVFGVNCCFIVECYGVVECGWRCSVGETVYCLPECVCVLPVIPLCI